MPSPLSSSNEEAKTVVEKELKDCSKTKYLHPVIRNAIDQANGRTDLFEIYNHLGSTKVTALDSMQVHAELIGLCAEVRPDLTSALVAHAAVTTALQGHLSPQQHSSLMESNPNTFYKIAITEPTGGTAITKQLNTIARKQGNEYQISGIKYTSTVDKHSTVLVYAVDKSQNKPAWFLVKGLEPTSEIETFPNDLSSYHRLVYFKNTPAIPLDIDDPKAMLHTILNSLRLLKSIACYHSMNYLVTQTTKSAIKNTSFDQSLLAHGQPNKALHNMLTCRYTAKALVQSQLHPMMGTDLNSSGVKIALTTLAIMNLTQETHNESLHILPWSHTLTTLPKLLQNTHHVSCGHIKPLLDAIPHACGTPAALQIFIANSINKQRQVEPIVPPSQPPSPTPLTPIDSRLKYRAMLTNYLEHKAELDYYMYFAPSDDPMNHQEIWDAHTKLQASIITREAILKQLDQEGGDTHPEIDLAYAAFQALGRKSAAQSSHLNTMDIKTQQKVVARHLATQTHSS